MPLTFQENYNREIKKTNTMSVFLPRKIRMESQQQRTFLLNRTFNKQDDIAQNTGLGMGTLICGVRSPHKNHRTGASCFTSVCTPFTPQPRLLKCFSNICSVVRLFKMSNLLWAVPFIKYKNNVVQCQTATKDSVSILSFVLLLQTSDKSFLDQHRPTEHTVIALGYFSM